MYVQDLAKIIIKIMNINIPTGIYNIGTGKDITIKNIAYLIQRIVGHTGNIIWNTTKPNGTQQKLLDVNKLKKYDI